MNAVLQKRKAFPFSLDPRSGVPVYRQIIDQVTGGIAAGALAPGTQLPTVRQVAVDLSINPNTVIRAYRELEIRGVLETQQGTGTFISQARPDGREDERDRRMGQLVNDFLARLGAERFTLEEAIAQLKEMQTAGPKRRK